MSLAIRYSVISSAPFIRGIFAPERSQDWIIEPFAPAHAGTQRWIPAFVRMSGECTRSPPGPLSRRQVCLRSGYRSLGQSLLSLPAVQAERMVRIIVGGAREAVRVWRGFGDHPKLRVNADVVGNAVPAALQPEAVIAAAPPGAAPRLVPAVAPESEHVVIFPGDDRAGGVMARLPFLRRQLLFAFAYGNGSPLR